MNANLQTIDGPIGREYDRTVSTGAATIPSCRKSRLRGALYIAAGSLLGYSAGVANFHAETWIDFSGRGVETRYSLFPFQMTATQSDRAFDLLLTPRVSRDPDWRRVGSDRFVSILGTCVLTEGYELLRAENRLVEVLTMKDFSRSQRREMERGFSLALQSGGAGAASDFATRTWEEAALTASDAEAPR
ncbi:MAG: hypothetical protein KJ579_08750 [Verrucomicrobia bacterium]|nr:hypothetical protein [Verrucomicrobiota bacterium]